MTVCARHPDRPTGLRCTRCGRPACPECLLEASVGHQCVDCVAGARRTVRRPVTVAGAPLRGRPLVVPVLIAVNVLLYLVTAIQANSAGDNQHAELFRDWTLWPPAVTAGDWWRLLTSGFLHFGPIHLALNMVSLWVLGRDLELVLGRLRFVAVYVLSLIGGSAAVFLFGDLGQQVAGASGAVFGLMGAMLVAVIRLRLNPGMALGVIALNLVLSVSVQNISLLGHIGGLVVGALAMVGMVYSPARNRTAWQAGTLAVLFVALVGLVVFRDVTLAETIECQRVPELECFYRSGS
ncbi:rhomboid family intramembrane serine protease [Goodfellowiella coeruleoviolacea]|uniref:Membrane associated serine protease, rhomboid family n=1 Tax=Goodfellowiella coeruleoviolacea TaxID=334858 RepID=A0AAE3KNS1_9PSEU|nr:rhomboid family intramembrane serine protease [Goodfellowiella coeruleoviolacea]MCP2168983.1 Membrane associated serine protease, rhomboid family [Goodfellowiella coeruleoviolacea]